MLETDHRQITVLFCDLSGSTALTESIDPEALRLAILNYRSVVRDEIVRYGGTVAEYSGDGVVAYFGYPNSTENDVETAIRAGLKIVRVVQQLVVGDNRLQAHIGIATGSVVVGDASAKGKPNQVLETPQPQFLAFGSPNNLASRLLSLAIEGSIVVSDLTRKMAGEVFEYEHLGKHELRGFAQPVDAWRIVKERLVSSRHHALRMHTGDIAFVGREKYVELLSKLCAEVQRSKSGRALLIHGEGGIGKSRLVERVLPIIESRDFLLLICPCEPHLTQSAYSPIVNQLCRTARIQHNDSPNVIKRKLKRTFSTKLKNFQNILDVFSFLVTGESDEIKESLQMSGERLLSYIFEELYKYLSHSCRNQPVVLIIEDMHWIDPSSAQMYKYLISRLADLPMLVLATSRYLESEILDSSDKIISVALNPLSMGESAQIVNNIASRTGESISMDLTKAICERSDGIPLFLEDITLDYFERRTINPDSGNEVSAIPVTLQDSLEARLGRLTLGRRIARVASVYGRIFDESVVREVCDLAADKFSIGISELIDSGLVVELSDEYSLENPKLKFKHILIRDAAYNSLTSTDKKPLHLKFAEILSQKIELGFARPEQVAEHYEDAEMWCDACNFWIESGKI